MTRERALHGSRHRVPAIMALLLLLAACGTRLPPSAFGVGGSGPGAAATAGSSGSGAAANAGGSVAGAVPGTSTGGGGGAGAAFAGGQPGAVAAGRGAAQVPVTGGRSNCACDVGVTPTSITIGNITSRTNPFGPGDFIPNFIGAQAYFDDLNAHGGVNGRRIYYISCDDQADPNQNQACAQQLIGSDHIFAMVANNIYNYAAASYVNAQRVPDIGGEPIGNAYNQYPYLFDIYGEQWPRDGRQIGQNGELFDDTRQYQWFAQHLGVHKIGIVYYDQAASQRGATITEQGAKTIGDSVVMEPVNLALPDYAGAVDDMKSQQVQAVFDELDQSGNAKLCQAMEDENFIPVAKVSTVISLDNNIASVYANTPRCRNIIYSTAQDLSFNDTSVPAVAQFRADMARYESQAMPTSQLHIWAMDGYAAAMWATDAIRSCGADVTRACVYQYMNTVRDYRAGGLFVPAPPHDFRKETFSNGGRELACLEVVQWQDSAGWVERANGDTDCFETTTYGYPAQ